jgi:PAS domain S-box-containing protein
MKESLEPHHPEVGSDDPSASHSFSQLAGATVTQQEFALLESVATPIVITARADGAVLFVNAAARRMFDLPQDDGGTAFLSTRFYAVPETRRAFLQELDETGAVAGREMEFVSYQGRQFWTLVSATPIEMSGGTVMLCSVVDITKQKSRENQLAQVTEQLRAQAAETQLLNRELQRQQQVAITANRAKSDFLARMSHELRSPLNAILGFSEIIAHDLLGAAGTPRYQNYGQNIHDAGAHLLSLINDILDLSKVEAGRMELKPEAVDVRELIESCLPLTAPLAERRGVAVATDLNRHDLTIEADRLRLRQIVLNILSNAVKFTLRGGTVQVKASVQDSNLEIEVTDSGIGMSAEQLEVALQPFGQVVTESPYAQVGTGLGLPIVVSLVELHRGQFKIDSTPNVGTRITICLPRRQPRD